MFRCSKCTLATLIVKAFNLQPYQFPGRTSLNDNTYEIAATIPPGASQEEFSAMLQNLLRNRFGLTWHFQEKSMKGYRLVIGKDGPKLKESTGAPPPRTEDRNWNGSGESHNHSGAIAFGTSASYRATGRTTADSRLACSPTKSVSTVDDQTGLSGKYDISLRWSGNEAAHPGNHADGAFNGGAGHSGHDGGGGAAPGPAADGPALFDALQQQLGLKLVPAEQAVARLFVIDRVAQRPTEN